MSICSCCSKVIKQISPVAKNLKGNFLCYRCANYVLYTEQSTITSSTINNKMLFSENSNSMFAFRPPVDLRNGRYAWLGYGGSWWKVECYDGSVAYTNNMWNCGDKTNVPKLISTEVKSNVKHITSIKTVEGLKAMGWYEEVKSDPIDEDWHPFIN